MAYALVTGASSGIGYELARVLAKHKHDLVMVSKDKEALIERAKILHDEFKVRIVALPKDLAQPNAAREIYEEVRKKAIDIDILVNNAGFGATGRIHDNDYDNNAGMIGVNATSVTLLTQLFLKDMLERKRGRILNVSSIVAFLPGAGMSVYYATKAYVNSLSFSVRDELRGTGVTLTCLCPGPTATNFSKRAELAFGKKDVMTAERVAEEGYTGMMRGKKLVVPGLHNKLIVFFSRALPRSWIALAMRQIK